MPEKTKVAPDKSKVAPDKTQVADSAAVDRSPAEQALQVIDVAVGAVPNVADAVRRRVESWWDPETRARELRSMEERGAGIRRQVTDQFVDRARKARGRVEPVYRRRVEPVYRDRVEPVYRERVEPTVRRVREQLV
jgi:hypothetical protein